MTNLENYMRLFVAAFLTVAIWYTVKNHVEIFAIATGIIFTILICWTTYEQWDD